jgi:hypothetical protein
MKQKRIKTFPVMMIFFLVMSMSLFVVLPGFLDDAAGSEGLDDLLEGFEGEENGMGTGPADEYESMDAPPSEDPSGFERFFSPFSLDGYFKLGSAYNFAHDKPGPDETDWRGLSKLRGELQLELNIRISDRWQAFFSGKGFYDAAYRINGRSDYTSNVLDHYEDDLELREAYVLGRLNRYLDIKFGRQIVVWGKSDTIRVTDILNPLDNREPGLTDLEDLRLPLAMTKLDYYFGAWNLSGIAIHEIRFDKFPKSGSDFFPYPGPLPGEDKPGWGGDNTEYAAALKGTFSGWDASFFYADVFRDTPHLAIVNKTWPIEIRLQHASLTMKGCAVNAALGNWIFKTEAAYINGLEFFNNPGESYSRTDVMAGIEYYGFDDVVIIMEAANRHINGFDGILKQFPDSAQKDTFQSVFRISRTFLNETLEIEGLLSFFGTDGKDGKFQRFSGGYDLNDAVNLLFGVLLYQSGDLPELAGIGDNDRLFFEVKYSF